MRKYAGFEILKEPLCCAVSIYHPLAKKDKLSVGNLYGENLMMIHRGWSRFMDEVRDELWGNHLSINLMDFDFYNVDVFNQCEQQKNVMLVIEKWSCVHPMMKVILWNGNMQCLSGYFTHHNLLKYWRDFWVLSSGLYLKIE